MYKLKEMDKEMTMVMNTGSKMQCLPTYRILTQDQIQRIHRTTLELLESVGVKVMHQEAVEMMERAIRMNPFPGSAFYHHLGYAYFNLERYEDAVATLRKSVKISPNGKPGRYGLIASLAQAGLLEEAKSNFKDFLKVRPQASVKDAQRGGIGKWADKRVTQRWADAFRKIGVPEEPQSRSSSGKG